MLLYKMRFLLTKGVLLCALLMFVLVSLTTLQWRTPLPLSPLSYRGNHPSRDGVYELKKRLTKDQSDFHNKVFYDQNGTGINANGARHSDQKEGLKDQGGDVIVSEVDVMKKGVNVSKIGVARGQRKMFQYVYGTATTSATTRTDFKVVNSSTVTPRLLCWILTDPSDLERRTKHVKATWAGRCDVTLYMSSRKNDSFPTVGLRVPSGRNHIAAKAKAAWRYIHRHYLNKADFFLKADPDTYIVVENLKEYLGSQDRNKAVYFGHRFHQPEWGYTYMSGGAGLVLTRESLRRLVEDAFSRKPDCMPDGQGEDWKTAKCLSLAGATSVDTRDSAGRERFLVFNPSAHVRGHYPDWYTKRDPDGALKGAQCCSNYPISFHYIKPDEMYVLDYFLYHARPHGKELVNL